MLYFINPFKIHKIRSYLSRYKIRSKQMVHMMFYEKNSL